MSAWALRVYRWCQQDVHQASQVSRAEVAAMVDGDQPLLPYVEEVIAKRHRLDELFDAVHTGKEDTGACLLSASVLCWCGKDRCVCHACSMPTSCPPVMYNSAANGARSSRTGVDGT